MILQRFNFPSKKMQTELIILASSKKPILAPHVGVIVGETREPPLSFLFVPFCFFWSAAAWCFPCIFFPFSCGLLVLPYRLLPVLIHFYLTPSIIHQILMWPLAYHCFRRGLSSFHRSLAKILAALFFLLPHLALALYR